MVWTFTFLSDWFHMVVVYHSGGLTVHHVGSLEQSDTSKDPGTHSASSGRMVIGRKAVDVNAFYTSVVVDELALWNRSLTAKEINDMY